MSLQTRDAAPGCRGTRQCSVGRTDLASWYLKAPQPRRLSTQPRGCLCRVRCVARRLAGWRYVLRRGRVGLGRHEGTPAQLGQVPEGPKPLWRPTDRAPRSGQTSAGSPRPHACATAGSRTAQRLKEPPQRPLACHQHAAGSRGAARGGSQRALRKERRGPAAECHMHEGTKAGPTPKCGTTSGEWSCFRRTGWQCGTVEAEGQELGMQTRRRRTTTHPHDRASIFTDARARTTEDAPGLNDHFAAGYDGCGGHYGATTVFRARGERGRGRLPRRRGRTGRTHPVPEAGQELFKGGSFSPGRGTFE